MLRKIHAPAWVITGNKNPQYNIATHSEYKGTRCVYYNNLGVTQCSREYALF
jgi:hypothetical protein